ncbi:MAG: GAF domain-containing protein, partial [Gemmatimonadota bacterium]
MRAFHRMSRLGALRRPPEAVGCGVLREFCGATGFTRAEIWLKGPRSRTMRLYATHGQPHHSRHELRLNPRTCPFTMMVLRGRRGLRYPNVCPDERSRRRWAPWKRVSSVYGAPLRSGDDVIGVIYADRHGRPFRMDASEIELAWVLTAVMAEIIDGSLEHRLQHKRHRQMVLLNRASRLIGAEERLSVLLPKLLRLVQRGGGYSAVLLGLCDPATRQMVVVAAAGRGARRTVGRRFSLGRRLSSLCLGGRAYVTGRPILIRDVADLPRPLPDWPASTRSILVNPVHSNRKALGALRLESERAYAFDEGDVEIFSILGEEIGHAVRRARVLEALRSKQADLKAVSERLESALEEDRQRIARELHDELAQSMTAAKINLDILRTITNGAGPSARALIAETTSLLDRTIAETRRISMDLRPAMLDDLGLLPTLRWYAGHFARRTGIRVALSARVPDSRMPRKVELLLYRFVQEALTNVARHAGAKRVRVTLRGRDGDLRAVVSDDGVGIRDGSGERVGLGLLGMRERIERLGGGLRIDSGRGRGTRLTASIPLDRSPGAARGSRSPGALPPDSGRRPGAGARPRSAGASPP